MTKVTRKYKTCPWCKSTASLQKEPLWHGNHGYHGCYEFFIRCDNPKCGCIAPHGKIDSVYRSEEEAIEKAIEIWNTRG